MGIRFADSTTLQPLAPPPRTSSREPSLSGDGGSARKAGPLPEPETSGQTVGVSLPPPQGSSTGLSGDTANERSESIGRGSKRSLTGRKREASAGSKHSARAAAGLKGKVPRPGSAGQPQAGGEMHSKRKGGFLAFLNCCAAKDEGQEAIPPEAVQPPKPIPKQQPVRAQQPLPAKQQQDVSATGTSMTGSETLDEKAPPSQPPAHPAEPILPPVDSEKLHHGDAAMDKPATHPSADGPRSDSNREMGVVDQHRQPAVSSEATTGGTLHMDTSVAGAVHETPDAAPYVQVQAPTPVVPQSEEEQVISDRTPQQAAVDEDLEMHDREPLTSDEAAVVAGGGLALGTGAGVAAVEEERHRRESRESSRDHSKSEVPPPQAGIPPPNEEMHTNTSDGKIPSHQSSIASDREEHKQWLLPPLKAELHGRKCLVLDLDETLVHSSFKVSFAHVFRYCWGLGGADILGRYYIRLTSRYRSRLKGSIIMSMS